MKRFRAAVVGGSGYGGAEIIRRLLVHPEVELVRVASVDHVGEPLGAVHLPLAGRTGLRFENLSPADAAAGCDIVLMGLPHKVSAEKAPAVLAAGAKVVDMSGDFRLRDAASYARFYGATHPRPELLGTFVYGLPELNRDAIRKARAVASPGCFATTVELGLLPLARAGKLRGTVRVVGITGSSGSGVAPSAGTHHPVRAVNLKTYRVLDHQHTPEILETLAVAGAPDVSLRFVPVSAPLSRGILATCFVELPAARTAEEIAHLFREAYAGEPFVTVLDRPPGVLEVRETNDCRLSVHWDAGTGQILVFAAIDNLWKGTASQAVQSLNLMFGRPETEGLLP